MDHFIISLNSNIDVHVEEIFIQFDCDNEIKGLNKNNNNLYINKIFTITYEVKDENNILYSKFVDICFESDKTYDEVFKYIIGVIKNDEYLGEYAKGKIEYSNYIINNDNVYITDIGDILDGYRFCDYSYLENLDTSYILLKKPYKIDDSNVLYSNLKLCKNDLETKSAMDETDIGLYPYKSKAFGYTINKDNVFIFNTDNNDLYSININAETKKYIEDKNSNNTYVSPNDKYIAYSDEDLNLYINDAYTKEIVYMLDATTMQESDQTNPYKHYSINSWLDETHLLYMECDYEWVNGIYILDIVTKENTLLEDSKGKRIYDIRDNLIYVASSNSYPDEILPYTLGYYDMSQASYPYKYVNIYNAENNMSIYEDEVRLSECYKKYSSDLKYLFIYGVADNDNKSLVIKKYDIENDKVVVDIKIDKNYNLPSSSIDDYDFIKNKYLVMYDDYYLYIINIE